MKKDDAIAAVVIGAAILATPILARALTERKAYLVDSDADAVSLVTFDDGSQAIAATYPDGSWRKPYAVFASQGACERELATLAYADEYVCEVMK